LNTSLYWWQNGRSEKIRFFTEENRRQSYIFDLNGRALQRWRKNRLISFQSNEPDFDRRAEWRDPAEFQRFLESRLIEVMKMKMPSIQFVSSVNLIQM
jgi:hypothetical protein